MNGDHISCASSPRGGLCKAFKDMKSKVATHTGISLSFVELVATSPAVGLLPVLPPSPRSPSALLHRWMHLHHHHNHTFSPLPSRRSSTEQSSHSDAELAMETLTCDLHSWATPVCCRNTQPSSRINGHSAASPCGYPKLCSCHMNGAQASASRSCGMVCKQPSSSSSCGHPQSASLCNQACGLSSSSSPSCDFWYRQPIASVPEISMEANGDTSASYKQALYSSDEPRGTSSAGVLKQTTNILDRTARVLYFLATLIFGLIGIIKSRGDIRKGSLCSHKFKHYMRVTPNAAGAFNEETSKVDIELERHGMQQNQQAWKATRQRSKLLKSKLRSSFKNLSVQVPHKAFAPLHLNTPTMSSMSSSSSSSSSSTSPACTGSPTAKSGRTPRSPSFARRLKKAFNQRAPQCSPASGVCLSPPSLCEVKQQTSKRATTMGNASHTMVASLVSFPLALCGLLYGKLVAGGVVSTWLLILSMLSKSGLGGRSSSPLCQI